MPVTVDTNLLSPNGIGVENGVRPSRPGNAKREWLRVSAALHSRRRAQVRRAGASDGGERRPALSPAWKIPRSVSPSEPAAQQVDEKPSKWPSWKLSDSAWPQNP